MQKAVKKIAKTRETLVITGASGFVGRHLVQRFIAEGYAVIAVDKNPLRCRELAHLPRASISKVLKADFTKARGLQCIQREVRSPCYLIHLAGYMPESSEKSLQYQAQRSIDTNISGSYNLIKALRPRLTGVCLASTVDVYGNASVPIDETHPVAPDTWYAASKLAMELYVAIELRDALPLAILRLSHIYGPGDPRPKAVRAFVDAVRSGVPPVIYGDGADLRDYIHVKDVAECIVRVLQVKARGIFNVATGRSLSLKAFAELAIKAGGRGMLPVYRQRRYPRKDYRFDVRKINSVLDFPPSVSIEQGIAELMSS